MVAAANGISTSPAPVFASAGGVCVDEDELLEPLLVVDVVPVPAAGVVDAVPSLELLVPLPLVLVPFELFELFVLFADWPLVLPEECLGVCEGCDCEALLLRSLVW